MVITQRVSSLAYCIQDGLSSQNITNSKEIIKDNGEYDLKFESSL